MNDIVKIGEQPVAYSNFDQDQRRAKLFSQSVLVPESLRKGGPAEALANCYIAIKLAEAMGESEIMVMQNMHVVRGKAGFDAKYMIARANKSGVFTGSLNWRITGKGDALEVTCFANLKETGEEVSFTASMAMAKAENWVQNPKYKSMPELMLRYRSATLLVRLYAPEVMLGFRTADEYEDMDASGRVVETVQSSAPLTRQTLLASAQDTPPIEGNVTRQGHSGDDEQPEQEPEPQQTSTQEQDDAGPPSYQPLIDKITSDIQRAENVGTILNIEREFAKHREALPDDVVAGVDKQIADAKARFNKGASA